MEVIIFMIVLCFLFPVFRKRKARRWEKRDTGAKQAGDRLSSADTEQTGK